MPSNVSTRERISPAALLVKVTARMRSAAQISLLTRWAIRWAITRVLPDPAPARIRSGPSVWRTASRCSGLRLARRPIAVGERLLFYRDAFREVPWLIDITASADRNVVRKQLQRNRHDNGGEERRRGRHGQVDVTGVEHGSDPVIPLRCNGNDGPAAGLRLLNVPHHLLEDMVVRCERHDRHALIDERNRSVLHLACRVTFGMDVRNLFQLQCALERDRVVDSS